MLKELSKRHDEWLAMAVAMGAGELAEDVVQDMYLRIDEYAKGKELCNTYIWFTLRNIFYDYKRKESKLPKTDLEDCPELEATDEIEREEGYNMFLERLDEEMHKWHWFDRMLFDIYLKKDKSMRQLAKETNIGVSTIFHTIKKCKDKVKKNLGEDWEDYRNNDFERI